MANPLNGNRTAIFLVYINDLAKGLVSDARLFADDTSLFSIVYDEQSQPIS